MGLQRERENVYLLVDRSPSVGATTSQKEITNQLDAIIAANSGKRFELIYFAKRASITAPIPSSSLSLTETSSFGEGTDLEAAVKLALATFPGEGEKHIVLLSDGNITDGLKQAISMARHSSAPISTLSLGRMATEDVRLSKLELPDQIESDQPFSIQASVTANQEGNGLLAFYLDGELRLAKEVELQSGLKRFSFTDTLSEKGTHTYRVVIKRPQDPISENDSLSTLVKISDRPKLLVVARGRSQTIISLLEAIGKPYVLTTNIPSLEELASYQMVLLTGISGRDLTAKDIHVFKTFVADLGGGLLTVEGEEELRGMAKEEIEELLPVSYTRPQKAREASLAVVFVLDRSSSMRGHATGATKIEILKETAAASINLLKEDDLVGVVAFDRNFDWLIPIQPVGNGEKIYNGLRQLEAGGGTDIYYPLVAALDKLKDVQARVKHILLLSDGKTINEYRDFPGLRARLEGLQDEITLSTIAIGPSPNIQLLQKLVQAGSGTLYRAYDFSSLPKISMQATQRLSRSRFITGEIEVDGKLAQGELAHIPPVHGYALTYPKPTAAVLLWADEDPLLACWQLGLGKVAVLNTDLYGKWTKEWLGWSKSGLLLDKMLSTVETGIAPTFGLSPSAKLTDREVLIQVDARNQDGEFANFLKLEALLIPTENKAVFSQIAPGFYRASFLRPNEGGYALKMLDHSRNKSAVLPFSVPYPAEYRRTGVDQDKLKLIAEATGGKFVEDEIIPELGDHQIAFNYISIHSHLLLAALALFLVELALRKIPRL